MLTIKELRIKLKYIIFKEGAIMSAACLCRKVTDRMIPWCFPDHALDNARNEFQGCWADKLNNELDDDGFVRIASKLRKMSPDCHISKSALDALTQNAVHIFARVVGNHLLQCAKANGRLFSCEDMTSSISFFLKKYPLKETEKTPLSPLQHIVIALHQIGWKGNNEDEKLFERTVDCAFAQHLFDPPHFVSHAFNHGLNVAYFCNKLVKQDAIWKSF